MSYIDLSNVKSNVKLLSVSSTSDDTASTATSDIILPQATRHAIEQGKKRGHVLWMENNIITSHALQRKG